MRIPVLKAVAMPPKIFWAPMLPAIVNFAVQMAVLIVLMGILPGKVNPNIFILTITVVHVGLIIWGTREPYLSTVAVSWKQARPLWDKEGRIKAGLLGIKASSTGEGLQIKNGQVRVVCLKGKIDDAAGWRKWLMAMARYPVTLQVWMPQREKMKIILSAEEKESYRLKAAVLDTMALLREFQPEELSAVDAAHLWEDILANQVKALDTGVFVARNSQYYTACLEINRWGDYSDTNMIMDLLSLDGEISIQHQFNALSSAKANALLIQQRKMAFFTTFSQNVYEQYTTALQAIDSLSEFPQVMVDTAMAVWVSAPTMAELEGLLVQAVAIFKQYGIQAARERGMAKACFLSQFPGIDRLPRRSLMLSDNVVSLLSLSKGSGLYGGGRY